jgi:hypothetical protein
LDKKQTLFILLLNRPLAFSSLIYPVHFLEHFLPQVIQQGRPVFFVQADFIKTVIIVAEFDLKYFLKVFGDFFNGGKPVVQDTPGLLGVNEFVEGGFGSGVPTTGLPTHASHAPVIQRLLRGAVQKPHSASRNWFLHFSA